MKMNPTYIKLGMLLGGTFMATVAPDVMASGSTSTGTDVAFEDIYTTVSEYTNGYLGKTVAIAIAMIGVIQGMRQQSLWAFVTCIAVAVGLNQLPTIIESLMGAGVDVTLAMAKDAAKDVITGVTLLK